MTTQGWYPTPPTAPDSSGPRTAPSLNEGAWTSPYADGATSDHGPRDFLDGVRLASKPQRLTSFVIDLGLFIVAPIMVGGVLNLNFGLVTKLILLGVLGLGVFSGLSGGNNFRSPGKQLMGIQAVRAVRFGGGHDGPSGQALVAPGALAGAARVVLHVLDMTVLLGLFVLMASQYHRSIADSITHTIHVQLNGARDDDLPKRPQHSFDIT